MAFAPTQQQVHARDLFTFGDNLAVEAGAGTGKTSTLKLLGESTPRRGQYVAFNKAIVVEASQKMPGNVACSTVHALAFRGEGRKYAHRLNSGRMRSMELARLLGLDPFVVTYGTQRKVLGAGYLASHVLRSITSFCQSAAEVPSTRHVPYIEGIDAPDAEGRRTWANNDEVARYLLPFLEAAWRDLVDPDGRLPYKHEHYLKAWQLSAPTIPADFIMLDEAQDANPVMLAVLAGQAHAQQVFVGDSQQQIYEFTGAVNALAQVPASQRAFLTQSFRFGPAIADVANQVLARIEGADLRLEGTPDIASLVCPVADPDVILSRTNATAVKHVLEGLRTNRRVHLVGGGSEVVGFAKAAQELMEGRPTFHPELACFDTWGEVQEYVANDPQGSELKMLVGLIDDYSPHAIIGALDRMIPEDRADLVVSTAHKSKGREWDTVQLAADFPDPRKTVDGDLSASELRLVYVAVTRAQRELDITACPVFDLEAPEMLG